MPTSLDDVLTPARDGDAWILDVPDGWQQGRGAFGGLVLGGMTRALAAVAGDARPLRTFSASIVAPVLPGRARIEVNAAKIGSAVSTLSATFSQEGATAAIATAVFGAPRPATPSWMRLSPPRTVAAFAMLPEGSVRPPPAATFTQHFDLRVVRGTPYSGSGRGEVIGWVRPRVPTERRDAALAIALADCYYPVAMAESPSPRPMATVTFHIDLCSTIDDLAPDAAYLHRATSPSATDGYAVEHRELWAEDGRLIALNQQVFVIIK